MPHSGSMKPQATLAESVDSVLRAQYDLSERERPRGVDVLGVFGKLFGQNNSCEPLVCGQSEILK